MTKSKTSIIRSEAEGNVAVRYCFWYAPTKSGNTPSAYVAVATPASKKKHLWFRWALAEELGLTEGLDKPTKSATGDRDELRDEANELLSAKPEPKAAPKGKARSKNAATAAPEVGLGDLAEMIAKFAAKLETLEAKLAD